MKFTELDFDAWIRLVFDHPGEGPYWHGDPDAPYWDGPPAVTLEYLTRLFEAPLATLNDYSDAQINRGLWYTLGSTGENFPMVLHDAGLGIDLRARCMRAVLQVHAQLFAAYCTPTLSHLDEAGASPLNSACYMWWDIMTYSPSPDDARQRPIDATALEVMRRTLALDHVACQESALHGLGHWHSAYPEETTTIIDGFLADSLDARPELIRYACAARTGCIQ